MPSQRGSARRRQRCVLLAGIAILLIALVLAAVLASALTGRKEEASLEPLRWQGRGTTRNLREIVLGRCYSYLAEGRVELGDKDCLKIWESLKAAFIHKNPCNATTKDYQPLMELASHPVPCNKSLFWSRTYDLVHLYSKSNQHFLTLEDTFLGYMLDGLSWCGDPSAPGINYESCPKWSECEGSSGSVFWKMASKMFAEAACGVVHVMLNGSIEAGAFRSSRDSCSGYSIKKLRNILEERNFKITKITCEDNYRPVQLLQCVHNPGHPDCSLCINSTEAP
ncbi:ADP-ribosyl cyclase/cyclic ADP-ribose hydrolase 1-like isoform X2 [Tympanuchus pallidicinctus]|uniref:ADP-ribosyl cyclase/cyclic ADP-ribose hydrolase 1-like isoform X2 n=1 Tax=Tympanuchus pallidicinctus TaxID=109042 RepID=UPI0022872390|nr:ADP-ribosyl cyclase/cyclic ADP-ribose hydrolase 1-like isoform X2 [Tympanuchus pallidicinctus]